MSTKELPESGNEADNELRQLLQRRNLASPTSVLLEKFGLAFNPFPKSGAANIRSNDTLVSNLKPVQKDVAKRILDYVVETMFPSNVDPDDRYLGAVIRGDYGSGKTQMLLYTKYLIESLTNDKEFHKNPYVVYIDNPGVKPSELIAAIVREIGEENFRKYVWSKILTGVKTSNAYQTELRSFVRTGQALFPEEIDPFSAQHVESYKLFLDAWLRSIHHTVAKKQFARALRSIALKILTDSGLNGTIAEYFFNLVSADIGINKSWEELSTGSSSHLDRLEVELIKQIVEIVKDQGYTDFYILADEFEDVTEGRLSKTQVDKYLSTLRTLIDKERTWCIMFAMTGESFKKLKRQSPPLADRIAGKIIDMKPLSESEAKDMVTNYLRLAREGGDAIAPFTIAGINEIRTHADTTRGFLKLCYYVLQQAEVELEKDAKLTPEFVREHAADGQSEQSSTSI